MGFFDSKTVNEQDITNRNVAIEGTDGITIASSENVRILDGGAIGGIQETALQAIRANRGIIDESFDFGRNAILTIGAAFEQAGSQTQRVLETTTGGSPASGSPLNRFDIQASAIRYGALALVVAVAGYYWMRK